MDRKPRHIFYAIILAFSLVLVLSIFVIEQNAQFSNINNDSSVLDVKQDTLEELLPEEDIKLIEIYLNHLITHLGHLINIRFWLYAFYFAMMSALLTAYSTSRFKKSTEFYNLLCIVSGILGQIVVLLLIINSSQIAGNYNNIHFILQKTDVVNIFVSIAEKIKESDTWYFQPEAHPFLPAIATIFLANISLVIFGIRDRLKVNEQSLKNWMRGGAVFVFIIVSAYIFFTYISMNDFRKLYTKRFNEKVNSTFNSDSLNNTNKLE